MESTNSNTDSFSFISSKGAIIHVVGKGDPYYKVESLQTASSGGRDTCGSMILIDSIIISVQDAATPKDAMNDTHAVYVFGKTFGSCIIKGTAYLGAEDTTKSSITNPITILENWFKDNRISKKKKPVKVSFAEHFKAQVFIDTLKFGNTNPKVNSIEFEISGMVAPA